MMELIIYFAVFFLVTFFLLPGMAISAALLIGASYQKSKHAGWSKGRKSGESLGY